MSCSFIVFVAKCVKSISGCPQWYQVLKHRNWKHGRHSCTAVNTGYWPVFWGPFRSLSKAIGFMYGFLREPCYFSWAQNPTQTLAAQTAVTHSFWFPLFILIDPEVLSWICIPDFCEVGAKAQMEVSLGGSDDFMDQIREREESRREGDRNSFWPLIVLYEKQSISHGAQWGAKLSICSSLNLNWKEAGV